MEDPQTFDLWGIVRADRKREAVAIIGDLKPGRPRPEILRVASTSAGYRRAVQLGSEIPWDSVRCLRDELGGIFEEIEVYQGGWGPDDRAVLKECVIHRVHYAGVSGCPICGGWYLRSARE